MPPSSCTARKASGTTLATDPVFMSPGPMALPHSPSVRSFLSRQERRELDSVCVTVAECSRSTEDTVPQQKGSNQVGKRFDHCLLKAVQQKKAVAQRLQTLAVSPGHKGAKIDGGAGEGECPSGCTTLPWSPKELQTRPILKLTKSITSSRTPKACLRLPCWKTRVARGRL
jgi:hypothetical protein